jgi:hypothetical protein
MSYRPPNQADVSAAMTARGCGMHAAKRALTQEALLKAIDEAETTNDVKEILKIIVSST